MLRLQNKKPRLYLNFASPYFVGIIIALSTVTLTYVVSLMNAFGNPEFFKDPIVILANLFLAFVLLGGIISLTNYIRKISEESQILEETWLLFEYIAILGEGGEKADQLREFLRLMEEGKLEVRFPSTNPISDKN